MNQCDGCRRELPVNERGNHIGPGGFWSDDVQHCTADHYVEGWLEDQKRQMEALRNEPTR